MSKSQKITLAAVAYILLGAVVYLIQPGAGRFMTVFGDSLVVPAAAFAVASTAWAAFRHEPGGAHRKIWLLLSLGMLLWFFGESLWWVMEAALGQEVPYPSIADAMWLAGYAPLLVGLILNFYRLDVKLKPATIAFLAAALGAVVAPTVYFILVPIVTGDISLTEKVLDIAYPLGDDLLLAAVFLTLAVLRYGVLSRPWKVIAAGFFVFAVADLGFAYMSFFELYQTGDPIDLLWVLGYLIVGVGAVNQTELAG